MFLRGRERESTFYETTKSFHRLDEEEAVLLLGIESRAHKSSKSTATLNRINGEKTSFRYIGPEIINGTAWETKRLRDIETRS